MNIWMIWKVVLVLNIKTQTLMKGYGGYKMKTPKDERKATLIFCTWLLLSVRSMIWADFSLVAILKKSLQKGHWCLPGGVLAIVMTSLQWGHVILAIMKINFHAA